LRKISVVRSSQLPGEATSSGTITLNPGGTLRLDNTDAVTTGGGLLMPTNRRQPTDTGSGSVNRISRLSVLFHVLYACHIVPYAAVNFFLLLVAPAAPGLPPLAWWSEINRLNDIQGVTLTILGRAMPW
jgi:hypothetical protein